MGNTRLREAVRDKVKEIEDKMIIKLTRLRI